MDGRDYANCWDLVDNINWDDVDICGCREIKVNDS